MCGVPELLPLLEQSLATRGAPTAPGIIRALGETRTPLALPVLQRSVHHEEADVRIAALEALDALAYPHMLPVFIEALNDADDGVLEVAARALGRFPLPEVRRALRSLAQAGHPKGSPAAIRALMAHGTQEARLEVEGLMKSQDELRSQLGDWVTSRPRPCKQCFEPTLTLALSDLLAAKDPKARSRALGHISLLRPESRALSIFEAATTDSDRSVRHTALDLIATSPLAQATGILVQLTEDSRPIELRIESTRHLVTRPAQAAIDRISQLILHTEGPLGSVAMTRLQTQAVVVPEHVDAAFIVASTATAAGGLRQVALKVVVNNDHQDAAQIALKLASSPDKNLARSAQLILRSKYPKLYAEFEKNQPSKDARTLFLGASGLFGGTTFGLLGSLRDGDSLAPVLSTVGGLTLGVGAAYLLTIDQELFAGPVGMYASGGLWGLSTGLGTAMAISGEDGSSGALRFSGALGLSLGAGLGALAIGDTEWSTGDVAFVNVSGIQASLGTAGLLLLPARGGDRVKAAGVILLGGAVLGTLPALGLSTDLSFSSQQAAFVAATSVAGAWFGAWTPRMFSDRSLGQRTGGGLLLGESLGYLGGVILSQKLELGANTENDLLLGTILGGTLGSGAGLLAQGIGPQGGAGLVQAGTLAGTVLLLSARRENVDPELIGLGIGLGTWLGAWTPTLYSNLDRDRLKSEAMGGAMAGASLAALLAMTAFEKGDVSDAQKTFSVLGTAAGAALGSGAMLLSPEASDQSIFRLMQATALTGLLAGAFGFSRLEIDGGDRNAALVATAYGALAGTLLPRVLSSIEPTIRSQVGGALTLSSLLGASAVLASPLLDLKAEDAAEIGAYSVMGAGLADGAGLLLDVGGRPRAITTLAASAVGLGAGFVLAPMTNLDRKARYMIGGTTAWGAVAGAGLPFFEEDSTSGRDVVGGIELGSALGFGAGVVLSQTIDRTPDDVAEMDAFALSGGALGLGLARMIPDTSQGVQAALFEVGTLSLGTAALLWAPHTEYDALTRGSMALLTGYGAWLGGWAPYLWNGELTPGSRQTVGGAMFGAGLGFVGSTALTQVFDARPQSPADVAETAMGTVASNMVGAGLGMMVSEDNRVAVGLMESVGLLGTVGVAALAPKTDFSKGDSTLGALWTAQALWNGLGASYLYDATDRQKVGITLAMAGLGGIGAATVSQYVDQSPAQLLMGFTGSVWGTWLGYFGSRLLEDAGAPSNNKLVLGATIASSDIGLLLGTLALSPLVDMAPERVGWINVGGLAGAVTGSTVGIVALGLDGANPGNVVGSGLGLLSAGIATAFFDFKKAPVEKEVAKTSVRLPARNSQGYLPGMEDVNFGTAMVPSLALGEAPNMVLAISGKLN